MADTSKTGFGFDQISNKTPEWANWLFRGWLILSNALTGFVTGLAALQGIHISPVQIGVILLSINSLNVVVYGFSKLFGVETDQADPTKPLIAEKQITDSGDTKAVNPVIVEPTAADSPTK